MDIKEIANKYTRAEFMDIIEDSISKDTFVEIGTETVMCPAEYPNGSITDSTYGRSMCAGEILEGEWYIE